MGTHLLDGLCELKGPQEELGHVDTPVPLNANRQVVEEHPKLVLLAGRMHVKRAARACTSASAPALPRRTHTSVCS